MQIRSAEQFDVIRRVNSRVQALGCERAAACAQFLRRLPTGYRLAACETRGDEQFYIGYDANGDVIGWPLTLSEVHG